MRTWHYKGTHNGYKTRISRHSDGDIVIFQSVDSHNPGQIYHPKVDCIQFNEKELMKVLKGLKKPLRSKKSKRGKKHAR